MSAQDDRTFLQHFSIGIAGLGSLTILLIALALFIHFQQTFDENPAAEAAKENRIAPVAAVHAGDTGRAALEAQAAEATPEAAAFDGALDGEMIFEQVCQVCHTTGAGGAPLMTAQAWAGRVDKGEAELAQSVINGLGAMPPRAGRPDLTDEQIEVTVAYILGQVQ